MDSKNVLKSKTAIVTGATAGIGLAAATALAAQGAFVIGVGRSAARCLDAEKTILLAQSGAKIKFLLADLSLQSQVRGLASDIKQTLHSAGHTSLDILVNNAGTFSGSYIKTPDGVELTLAVNHIAPFLLTHELLPLLKAAPSGRVITVSSGSHYHTSIDFKHLNAPWIYNGLWAYKVSKMANVLFTLEFNRQMKDTSVRAFAVDPGLVNTEIGLKTTDPLARLIWQFRRKSGVPPEIPARTILYLACENSVQYSSEGYWYDCHPRKPDPQALRLDNASKLWEISCQMCGLAEPGKEISNEQNSPDQRR